MKTGCLIWLAASPVSASTSAAVSPTLEWWRVLLLVIIFGGLLGVWWWLNRGKLNLKSILKASEQKILIQGRSWLNSRTSIVLLEVDGERFLLAHNQHHLAWQKLAKTNLEDVPPPVR